MTSTSTPVTTDERPVTAPAARLTAERENEPLTGNDWQKLPTMLASPWPISSWLGSMRCRVRVAIAFAIEIASMKPTSVMTNAVESSVTNVSQSRPRQRRARAGPPESRRRPRRRRSARSSPPTMRVNAPEAPVGLAPARRLARAGRSAARRPRRARARTRSCAARACAAGARARSSRMSRRSTSMS